MRMRKSTWTRLGIAFTLCGLWLGSAAAADEPEQVSQGVFVEGSDVGGMTREEVLRVISGLVEQSGQTMVTVTVEDQSVSCSLNDLGLDWANKEILNEICHLGATGNIVQRYKDQKDLQQQNKNFELTYQVDADQVEQFAQGLTRFNSEPVNATIYTTDSLTPGVEGGTDGITVDVTKTKEAVIEAAKDWDGSSPLSVEAVTSSTAPEVTYEDLAIVSDVLGSATTDYSASTSARAANVENGCAKITGTLLQPGDSFSVTDALVPFTAENGYEQAPSYEENRVVDSYGGGICQVSTTLYNAVLKAELEVTQRSNHTMVVSYVDLSKDAAIAEGVMDLCFYNSLEDPVYIVGYCYGGQISFIVYGHETRPANRSIEFESRTISTIEPTEAKLYPNAEQAVGYINQTQSPHTGYTAELWKNIYVDGVLTDSVQINSSYYTAVGTIYDVGVKTDNTALYSAIYNAISANSISQVQAVIANANSYTVQSETTVPQTQPAADGTAQTDGAAGTDSAAGTDGSESTDTTAPADAAGTGEAQINVVQVN